MIRQVGLLLVDDHPVVRAGLCHLFEADPGLCVLGHAASGEEACRLYPERRPEVVLMDLSLPGMSGLEAARRLLQHHPGARLLICTIHENPVLAERALVLGILGYVTKSSAPDILIEAVKTVASGRRFLSPDMAQALALRRLEGDGSPLQGLSPREFEVFRLVVEGRGRGEIAALLHLSPKTVSNLLSRIRGHLGVGSDLELLHIALSQGLIDHRF